MKKLVLILLLSLGGLTMAFSQEREIGHFGRQIYFKKMYTLLDTAYKDNAKNIAFIMNEVGRILKDPQMGINKISIVSSASPDGFHIRNEKYSDERAANIIKVIEGRYPETKDLYEVKSLGIDWEGAIRVVEESDVVYKDEVLKILKETPIEEERNGRMVYPRHDQLFKLRGGVPYKWLTENSFKELRKTVVEVYYWKEIPEEPIVEKDTVKPAPVKDTVKFVAPVIEPMPQPCFAIKTNVLYDFAATPNFGIEIPIKKKWSIGANYTFPWWIWADNARAYQILYWDVYARRWLGNREKKDVLSGWFVGLIGGGGYYDIEPHRAVPHRGYQGWGLTASLEGGYAFYLSDRWSLEFSIAAGYMHTDYAKYKAVMGDEHLVWQHDDHRDWWGPTKANASLVYLIYHKGDKAKRRQIREQRRHENENY
ncbi:MAG: DUF3575 domain-containing protein [Bacteroidales bacterium]|nr:DUF3575 domain-containing protein [Bacteroidales bacterium]